jgi:tRNA-2-methylthio-N6-dimethylallyladenosine synthase
LTGLEFRMSSRVYIETYGCQMNVNDSHVLAGRFQLHGCRVVDSAEEADIILLNTCAIRENAEERVFGRIGELKKLKNEGKDVRLGVTGCMAQRLGAEILERAGHVDLVVGTGAYGKVFELLQARETTGEPQVDLSFGQRFTDLERPALPDVPIKTFLSIMEGCNKSCSYCIVPYTRGKERYKPLGSILREAEELVARGVKEISLLGQNINSWREGKWRFADVLVEVGKVRGLERIRFTTSHPINTDERMLRAMADTPAVCETLQLPIQSGSDRILSLMRRGYTLEKYRRLVDRARELMPGLALTTDIIVGFPGETDEDFARTVEAMESIRFDSAFMFVYSARRGTRAAAMEDAVPADVADARLQTIIALQRRITDETSRARIGHHEEVLFEGAAPRNPGHLSGKTRTFKTAIVPGPVDWIGTTRTIRVTEARGITLFGEALPASAPRTRDAVHA